MVKKLPSVFANRISPEVSKNKKVFYSEKEITPPVNVERKIDILPQTNLSSAEEVELELRKLFKSTSHIFNIPVEIVTNEKSYDTKIAGRVQNQIITIDNDLIKVSEIVSIKRKDRYF